jgi:hypothetical protein
VSLGCKSTLSDLTEARIKCIYLQCTPNRKGKGSVFSWGIFQYRCPAPDWTKTLLLLIVRVGKEALNFSIRLGRVCELSNWVTVMSPLTLVSEEVHYSQLPSRGSRKHLPIEVCAELQKGSV